MKHIGRAFLILFAAAIVAGGIYAIVGDGDRQPETGAYRAAWSQEPEPDGLSHDGGRHGAPRRGDHSREGASLGRGLGGVVGNLVVIALVTLVVTRVRFVRRAVGLAVVLLVLSPAQAADVPELVAHRVAGKIQVDGVLSENVWKLYPAISNLVQVEPRPGDRPTAATQLWIAYSANALYIAIRCQDREARQIVATKMRRDAEFVSGWTSSLTELRGSPETLPASTGWRRMDVQTGDLTRDDRLLVPGKNLAVGRVKANFLSQSYIGVLFTNGDPTGETSNQVGGVDLKFATSNFLKREKNLSLALFGTKSRTGGLEGRDSSYGAVLAYPNDLVSAQYKWMKIGENYNPALGFVPRPGVRISALEAELSPRPKFWGIRQMSFEMEYSDYYNLAEHSTETRQLTVTPLQWAFHSGEWVDYEYEHVTERLYEPWEIEDGVVLPVGEYTFSSHGINFRTSETRPFFGSVEFGTGSFFGGTRREARMEATWRKDHHLSTALTLEQNWLRLQQGHFNTSLLMYRLDYSFTPFITVANFVQYDTESRNVGLQSRLRWILRPGNEFFIVLNHAWQENQFNRFEAAQTRFRVKFNYTFRF